MGIWRETLRLLAEGVDNITQTTTNIGTNIRQKTPKLVINQCMYISVKLLTNGIKTLIASRSNTK